MGAAGRPLGRHPLGRHPHDLLGQRGIGAQILDHHLHRHRGMVLVPAVVVGDHRQGGIGDFGLPGQAGFGVVGHADHRTSPGAVELRFGPGGEGGPFHAEVSATSMQLVALWHQALAHVGQQASQGRAEGIPESHVGHQPIPEQGRGPLLGAVNELVRHQHVQGPDLPLQ